MRGETEFMLTYATWSQRSDKWHRFGGTRPSPNSALTLIWICFVPSSFRHVYEPRIKSTWYTDVYFIATFWSVHILSCQGLLLVSCWSRRNAAGWAHTWLFEVRYLTVSLRQGSHPGTECLWMSIAEYSRAFLDPGKTFNAFLFLYLLFRVWIGRLSCYYC